MKLSEKLEALRLRAGSMWREHKERAEEKRAAKATARVMDEHHGRFFLLTVPAAATILAAITEWYWAILFCIEATGAIDWNYETAIGSAAAPSSLWNFAFSTHWPVFLGLLCATVPIVMLSMVWLPVQFAMRGTGRIRRGSIIAVGLLANILVIVSGTVVMNYNRQDQVRESLVIEQTAAAGRGAIQAQIDAVNGDLERLTDRRVNNEYAATAANVGAVAYRAQYMSAEALARSPESRRDIIVRALGAAERADALRAERTALFQQLAQAPTEAAVAANVEDTVGRELNTFAQYVEVWRPPFIAVICTLIGIFGTWWVIAMLEKMNPRDVLSSGWADEGHRIEDLRAEEPVATQPMQPYREKMYDAQTGEELIPRRGGWVRKPKRKGKPEKVDMSDAPPPDERGVDVDGGSRIASPPRGDSPGASDKIDIPAPDLAVSEPSSEGESGPENKAPDNEQAGEHEPVHEPSEADDAAVIAAYQTVEPELFAAEPVADVGLDVPDQDHPSENAEGQQQDEESPEDHPSPPDREEPETRPERMIGVAAE